MMRMLNVASWAEQTLISIVVTADVQMVPYCHISCTHISKAEETFNKSNFSMLSIIPQQHIQ